MTVVPTASGHGSSTQDVVRSVVATSLLGAANRTSAMALTLAALNPGTRHGDGQMDAATDLVGADGTVR